MLYIAYLYDRNPVVPRSSNHLRGDIRMPGNAGTPHLRAGVSHLDDWLILMEIPDN